MIGTMWCCGQAGWALLLTSGVFLFQLEWSLGAAGEGGMFPLPSEQYKNVLSSPGAISVLRSKCVILHDVSSRAHVCVCSLVWSHAHLRAKSMRCTATEWCLPCDIFTCCPSCEIFTPPQNDVHHVWYFNGTTKKIAHIHKILDTNLHFLAALHTTRKRKPRASVTRTRAWRACKLMRTCMHHAQQLRALILWRLNSLRTCRMNTLVAHAHVMPRDA
jgi:hypothetical protein